MIRREASVSEWMGWMALPIQTILKEHKDLVYGPVDDLVDEIFRKIAPEIVNAVGERKIDEGVEDFESGAIEGRFEALAGEYADPEPGNSEDYNQGYAWGFSNARSWDDKELPDSIERKVVREQIQWYRKNVTEQVVVDLLEKAWHAVSPMNTIKAMITAVKKHGWKIGIGFALFELFEHAVLPTVMIKLTGNPSMAILGTLPIGEIVYAVALRVLGKADKKLDRLEEDGHLDWYESKYGPVRLASARRASCVRVARRYSSR